MNLQTISGSATSLCSYRILSTLLSGDGKCSLTKNLFSSGGILHSFVLYSLCLSVYTLRCHCLWQQFAFSVPWQALHPHICSRSHLYKATCKQETNAKNRGQNSNEKNSWHRVSKGFGKKRLVASPWCPATCRPPVSLTPRCPLLPDWWTLAEPGSRGSGSSLCW